MIFITETSIVRFVLVITLLFIPFIFAFFLSFNGIILCSLGVCIWERSNCLTVTIIYDKQFIILDKKNLHSCYNVWFFKKFLYLEYIANAFLHEEWVIFTPMFPKVKACSWLWCWILTFCLHCPQPPSQPCLTCSWEALTVVLFFFISRFTLASCSHPPPLQHTLTHPPSLSNIMQSHSKQ